MDETILRAVERAIVTMRENLGEKLTIDDLARSAMFSKFHFSRVFQRMTGVSPGRFLSAMRLEEAKRLLLTTSATVADIGHQVGYNSVGTFSSRFRSSVGVSPIAYRQLGGVVPRVPRDDRYSVDSRAASMWGHVQVPAQHRLGAAFIALFPTRVPEGAPATYRVCQAPGPYLLPDVPAGTWYLYGHAIVADDAEACEETDAYARYVGFRGPIVTRSGRTAAPVDMQLHPIRPFDPPLLLALPDLRAMVPVDLAG